MRTILQYWFVDRDVDRDWRRDPMVEGPVVDPPPDPPDTVTEILSAVGTGAKAILVKCTSHPNRDDLAGRVTAALATGGRVYVTAATATKYSPIIPHSMLDGLVPRAETGRWNDSGRVHVVGISELKDIDPALIDSVVILAAPRRLSNETSWNDAAAHLAAVAGDKVKVEFTLDARIPRHRCSGRRSHECERLPGTGVVFSVRVRNGCRGLDRSPPRAAS